VKGLPAARKHVEQGDAEVTVPEVAVTEQQMRRSTGRRQSVRREELPCS